MASITGQSDADRRVLSLLRASVEAAGGVRALAEGRRLPLLTELAESACVLYLQEDEGSRPEAIADRLAIDRTRVEEFLSAPVDLDRERLRSGLPGDAPQRRSLAGAIVKSAYREQPRGHA